MNTDWQEGERVLVRENGHTREMSRSQKRAMETASVSHDEEHQHAVISFADGAKVQQNSETTKDKEQKKNCHRRTTEHVSSLTLCLSKNLIA